MAVAVNGGSTSTASVNRKKKATTSVNDTVNQNSGSTPASANTRQASNYNTDDALYRTATDSNDYKKLMQDAADAGDLYGAAQYEQKRNAKIDAMDQLGLNPNAYTKSNQYSAYLQRESVLDKGGIRDDGSRFDYSAIMDLYQQMQDAQNAAVDYDVNKAIADLQRAQEDAQKGFEAQQRQVNIDEAQARDRQVLYAAARGDRGGITARQYDSISNTAANNRQAIAQQQQQLATDTARQIADLRAQGEFQKAEAVLQIAQQQLAQLWELQQYQDSIYLQEQQLAMNESALTGIYNGQKTYEAQMADKELELATKQQDVELARQIVDNMIQIGNPNIDEETIKLAGYTKDYVNQMAAFYKSQLTAKKSSGGGGGSSVAKTQAFVYDQLADAGMKTEDQAYAWLVQNGYTATEADRMAQGFMDHLATLETLKEQNTLKVNSSNRPVYGANGELASITVNGSTIKAEDLDSMLASGLLTGTFDKTKNLITYYLAGNSY